MKAWSYVISGSTFIGFSKNQQVEQGGEEETLRGNHRNITKTLTRLGETKDCRGVLRELLGRQHLAHYNTPA